MPFDGDVRVFQPDADSADTNPVLRLLLDARATIERGWCQNQDDDGKGNFCILGALQHNDRGTALLFLASHRLVVPEMMPKRLSSIAFFNDTPGRTKAEVLELFDKAIATFTTP